MALRGPTVAQPSDLLKVFLVLCVFLCRFLLFLCRVSSVVFVGLFCGPVWRFSVHCGSCLSLLCIFIHLGSYFSFTTLTLFNQPATT